jgi:hypothetical protein
VTTTFPFVTFRLWLSGILLYLMNTMVSIPLVPGMPWARHLSSLVYDLPHRLEYFELRSNCHISMSSPVSLLRTALRIMLGNLRWARLDAWMGFCVIRDFRVGFDACQDKFLFDCPYFAMSLAGGLVACCFASCILGWGADGA